MKVDGRCHCGALVFEAVADPARAFICHCTDCQILSGTAYRTNVPAPADGFRFTRGTPKIYVKIAASGNRRAQAFCADCGTPIYAADADAPTSYTLRTGSLRQRDQIRAVRQIWCGSALDWTQDISVLPQNEKV